MRIGIRPEGILERALSALPFVDRLVPTPLAETQVAMLQARAVIAAVELGMIEALADGPKPAASVAAACATDAAATRRLLDALAASRYVRRRAGRYALTPKARRWLSSAALGDKLLFLADEWTFTSALPAFVRTGEPVALHDRLDAPGWSRYQKAMRAMARLAAPEVARRVPVPRRATRLLDLGGSHGLFSAALCARHPTLRATVLDLPEALPEAAPFDGEPGADRVSYQPGDLRSADLGERAWDAILLANVAHHLSADENADLARRAAQALRPGGTFTVLEWTRPEGEPAGIGPLLDLYFALTSASGAWSAGELRGWMTDAGLQAKRTKRLRSLPGTVLVSARR